MHFVRSTARVPDKYVKMASNSAVGWVVAFRTEGAMTENSRDKVYIRRRMCFSLVAFSFSLSLFFLSILGGSLVLSHSSRNVSRQGAFDTFIPYIYLTRTFQERISRPWGTCLLAVEGRAMNTYLNYATLSISFILPWKIFISGICIFTIYVIFLIYE